MVEGSEIVTVNGEALIRERDYRIDYERVGRAAVAEGARDRLGPVGRLFLRAAVRHADKTLVGGALKFVDRQDLSLGGAFIYESRGARRSARAPARSRPRP